MQVLELDEEEVEFLSELLSVSKLDLEDAKNATVDDPGLTSPELLLEVISGIEDRLATLQSIRDKLDNGTR
jgi:hypothetical protein